ncbi:MAG TPA: Rpn family recombination-promoting nuclease/putative transposase [Rickettsia endosymbiont of Degeeriella rufa]|nr:Rpn family recombination-promoting nuclease/putative transposase [Rickettsia endosymbiont of Degeeriella rufa]
MKVNPKVDLAFKKIFGGEENKDLLISLINSIVSEKNQVKEVTLLNPYNPKNLLNKDKLLKELNNKELRKALNVLEVIKVMKKEKNMKIA